MRLSKDERLEILRIAVTGYIVDSFPDKVSLDSAFDILPCELGRLSKKEEAYVREVHAEVTARENP